MASKALRSSVTRFLIWRTYHQMEVRLGRIPFATEIAAEIGLHTSTVSRYLAELEGCDTYMRGQNTSMRPDEDDGEITLDVVQYMERNSG